MHRSGSMRPPIRHRKVWSRNLGTGKWMFRQCVANTLALRPWVVIPGVAHGRMEVLGIRVGALRLLIVVHSVQQIERETSCNVR